MKKQIKKYLKKFLGIEKTNPIPKTLLDRLKENGLKVGENFNMLP